MNWYKLTKFAFPIITKPLALDDTTEYLKQRYSDFLHRDIQETIIWFVDDKYNLHQQKSRTDTGHADWDEYMKFPPDRKLASGRYSERTHEASMTIVWSNRKNPHRYLYVRNMVGKVLDKEFDNPTIRELY